MEKKKVRRKGKKKKKDRPETVDEEFEGRQATTVRPRLLKNERSFRVPYSIESDAE